MYTCLYDANVSTSSCPNERALDFDFCISHLNTPRGRQHVMDTIQRGNLTTPSMVEQAIKAEAEIPDEDYQTTALERMSQALDLIQGWVDESRSNLDKLGGSEKWRYKDRAGTEQQRTELGVYERALDRMSRHLTAMSKVALQDKIVTLGKAQVDMMIRMMLATITDLALDSRTTDRAKAILLSKFEEEANLVPRVEKHAREALVIEGSTVPTGGVTGVSIRGERIA